MIDPLERVTAVLATPSEQAARDRLTHAEWGERLTVEQFCLREERLRSTAWARDSMQTWLLVDAGARAQVLASLETFRVCSRHGMRPGTSYEVASVFTDPELRGHGYASRLLELVIAANEAQAFTLYSDVGEALYARLGFVARPAFDLSLPAAPDRGHAVERRRDPALLSAPRGRFALLPDLAQVEWHRERERLYAQLLGRPTVEHALLVCDGGHALLAGDLKNDRLYVLAIAGSADATQRLVAAAQDEASRASLREVVLWETPGLVVPGAVRAPRDGALPMLRPHRHGLDPASWVEIPRLLWV